MSKVETSEKERLKAPLLNLLHKGSEEIELDAKVFNGRVSKGSIYRAIHQHLANRRQGDVCTKTRAEVSGSGRKPWRQKGTGRARVGSIRTPLWYHGGIVFGPKPREFNYSLPKKIKRLALQSALNDKAINKNLILIDNLVLPEAKTSAFIKLFQVHNIFDKKEKILLIIDAPNENVIRATRNIPYIGLTFANQVNTYDVMSFDKVIITLDALKIISKRLSL